MTLTASLTVIKEYYFPHMLYMDKDKLDGHDVVPKSWYQLLKSYAFNAEEEKVKVKPKTIESSFNYYMRQLIIYAFGFTKNLVIVVVIALVSICEIMATISGAINPWSTQGRGFFWFVLRLIRDNIIALLVLVKFSITALLSAPVYILYKSSKEYILPILKRSPCLRRYYEEQERLQREREEQIRLTA